MDWLARRAALDPGRPALAIPGGSVGYRELDEMAERAAGALRRQGAGTGTPVAVVAERDLATVTALWAVPRAGALLVPLDPRSTSEQLRRRAEEARVELAVGEVAGVRCLDAEGLLRGPAAERVDPPSRSDHSVVFTSGSGGEPRGVRLTWANLEASAAASAAVVANGAEDRWLSVLPLAHVGGLSILWRSAREGGAVVLEPRFDPERVAHLLARGEATVASLVPTMLHRLLEVGQASSRRAKAVLAGGASTPVELISRSVEMGLPVMPTYGTTETASQVATMRPGEAARRPHASGRPLPGVELEVVGRRGEAVPPGTVGEIRVRGDMVSPGYLHGPTRRRGEWLATGDLGSLDEGGYLTVWGRMDQAVLSGGETVHPAEVERALESHPAVSEAAVYGEPDQEWGQVLVAAVLPVSGRTVDLEELRGFLQQRLAGYQVPRRLRMVDGLPRTPLGKIDRRALLRQGEGLGDK